MGCDAAGNRYYENRVDYPYGQHRWVEPGDINNFDASSIGPEWHGWMTSMHDATPATDESYIQQKKAHYAKLEDSNAPESDNIGHREHLFNFHNLHNQTLVRSRGFNVGNPMVGLPPGAPDAYYTQPGSPYNPASIRKLEFIGDLDEDKGGGRPYKSNKWRERLRTAEEKAKIEADAKAHEQKMLEGMQQQILNRKMAARTRGMGTVIRK